MTTDIFVKSYRGDFDWLRYLLRSITKFTRGFRDVHIVVPVEDAKELESWGLTREKVHVVKERGNDPYLFQQVVKLNADLYTDAEVIVFTDSDTCFHRDITPEDFFTEGKPWMLITPYTVLPPEVPWKPITEKALGFECPYETMRRLPYVYPRWLLPEFRRFMEVTHHQSVEDYVMSQPRRAFSEFNALGSWARVNHPEAFFWWDTSTTPNLPQTCLHQGWSWGGLTPEIQRNLEEILK